MEVLGEKAVSIKRFPTGLANYVFDVVTDRGRKLVVRLARPELKFYFEGALYWYPYLQQKGIPIPELIYSNIDGSHKFPTMIISRLPGEDLGLVYSGLSRTRKKNLAEKIIRIQSDVATLPPARGFGYARSYEDKSLRKKWIDVLDANLAMCRQIIDRMGIINPSVVDSLKLKMGEHEIYFKSIGPVCFLDDITTKNVVINRGELSGVVDIDNLCFGDPLMTVALTKMSLLSRGLDTYYSDYWISCLKLSRGQEKALETYMAMFCVFFMSEIGQVFNKSVADPVNVDHIKKLTGIFEDLLKK